MTGLIRTADIQGQGKPLHQMNPISIEMQPVSGMTPAPSQGSSIDNEAPSGRIDLLFDAVSKSPNKAYACTCCTFCGFFFLFVICLLVVGSAFFPFSNEVPLYLRNHVTKKRMDAIKAGQDVADFVPNLPDVQLRQSVDTLPGGDREDLTLEIIYLPKYGDVLETGLVEKIKDFEARVMSRTRYDEHCLMTYSTQEVEYESTNNIDMVNQINSEKRACHVHHTIFWSCDHTLGIPCIDLLSTPVGLLSCNKTDTCTSQSEMHVDPVFKVNKTHVYANSVPDRNTPAGLNSWNFLQYVDSQFGPGNQVARAVKTEFTFGTPLKGYANSNVDPDGQSEDLTDWLYDTYHSWLMDGQLGGGVSYVFNGHGMLGKYLAEVLIADAMFALASMVFVLVYIAFMKSSWWLSLMGMGQILMSFPVAYFIYFGIFQQRYFGVFNMLSVFIILGIGADDIFVFLDTWELSSHKYSSLGERMSWTWKHAGKAMLVTSLSTFFSFMSNASSSFPAIQTFGIFAAMLVLVNYCAVMVYYPTVVLFYSAHFDNEDWRFCFGVPEKLKLWLTKEFRQPTFRNVRIVTDEHGDEVIQPVEVTEPPVNRWFRESYSSGIIGAKVGVILVYLVLIIFLGIQAGKVEPDKKNPQFMPSTNNYQRFMDANPAYFARGGSVDAIMITLAWGFNKDDPIDRSGTVATDADDPGKPRWDPEFNLPKASQCIHHICEKAQEKSDERKTGGYPDYPIDCFVLELKKFIDANDTALWGKVTGPGADSGLYYELFGQWFTDPTVVGKWGDFIFAEEGAPGDVELRFIIAELKLTVTFEIEVEDGKSLWNVWEDWFNEQYNAAPCREVANHAAGFQSSMDFIYVRAKLVEEALGGIVLSIGLALAVLVIATTNVLVAFYAVLVITCVVICTMGTTVLIGWKLGILESIGLVMVPGLSVDFVAHLAEAYVDSEALDRTSRVRDMLARVGISIVSGAISTLGASTFLFFPLIVFFNKFGTMIFMTIGYSLFWSLMFFPALMSTPFGPEGDVGNWLAFAKRMWVKYKSQ